MRRLIALSLALAAGLALSLSLSACGGSTASSSSAPSVIPPPASLAPASSAAPSVASASAVLGEATENLAVFLSAEQVQLYKEAHDAYQQLIGFNRDKGLFLAADTSYETVEKDGNIYVLADGEINTYQAFTDYMNSLFTEDCWKELAAVEETYPMVADIDGALGFLDAGRGGNLEYVGPDLYRAVEIGDEEAAFMVVGQYADFDTSEPYTAEIPIHMVKTPEGWRIDTFALTY